MAEWSKAADCKSADTVYEGSNPSPTTISYNEADLAQQVEHIHGKDGVSSSNLEVGSSNSKTSRNQAGGLYFFCISYVPQYTALFSEAWLWKEWSEREALGYRLSDTGIDIVA
jgi:hypothetical protein